MSVASHPSRHPLSPVGLALALVARFREAFERRAVVRTLASFDEHMLRDIGLTRYDVEAALVEPLTTDPTMVLADRAQELRRNQRALAREAQAWAA